MIGIDFSDSRRAPAMRTATADWMTYSSWQVIDQPSLRYRESIDQPALTIQQSKAQTAEARLLLPPSPIRAAALLNPRQEETSIIAMSIALSSMHALYG